MDEMETAMANIHKMMDANGDRHGQCSGICQLLVRCRTQENEGVGPGKHTTAVPENGQQPGRQRYQAGNAWLSGRSASMTPTRTVTASLTSKEYVQSIIIWFADMDPNRDSLVTMSEWNSYWIGRCK